MTEPDPTPPREPPMLEGTAEPRPDPHPGPHPDPGPTPWAAAPPPPPQPEATPVSPSALPPAEPASPRPRATTLLWLGIAAFVVLAGAQAALWMRVLEPSPATTASQGAAPPALAAVDSRLAALDARVTKLEQRPAPDLGPLTARVTALEQRPPAPPADQSPSDPRVSNLEARLAQLEQRPAPAPPPDLGPLQARIATLEQKTTAASAAANAAASTDENLVPRLAADEARVATLEKTAGATAQLAERANRIARVQSAFVALSLGQPLGALPGAPPALARYATTAPPTEASLRLAFPAAARAALAADHPSGAKPLLERLWAEAQDLVTVRQGEQVLVGDPAAGVLIHAQAALTAGDLAGAVAAVASLTGSTPAASSPTASIPTTSTPAASSPTGPTLTSPAAEALAGWLAQARGLLAARAALAEMAAQT